MHRFLPTAFPLIILILTSCADSSRQQNNNVFQQQLSNQYTERETNFVKALTNLTSIDSYDSLETANTKFAQWLLSDTCTFYYDFPTVLSDSSVYINITSSADNNIRIYSWNTFLGGTMACWRNVIQYRSNGSLKTFNGCVWNIWDTADNHNPEENESDYQCFTDTIYTFKRNNNQTVYVTQSYFRESSQYAFSTLEAFCIDGGNLKPIDDLFSKSNENTEIGTEYNIPDWFFRTDGLGWDHFFTFHQETQSFYVPIADNETLLDQYDIYTFNGDKFVYTRSDGGYWLHPSIRKFDQLEKLVKIDKFLIRIDKTAPDTYRYTAWSDTTDMLRKPDIIIENGTYDESISEYRFTNRDYTYLVSIDDYSDYASLTVNHKNKTILTADNQE